MYYRDRQNKIIVKYSASYFTLHWLEKNDMFFSVWINMLLTKKKRNKLSVKVYQCNDCRNTTVAQEDNYCQRSQRF